MWRQDPKAAYVKEVDPTMIYTDFNPTAENMCEYLVEVIGPQQLEGTGCELVEVTIEETAKCFATYTKGTVVHETA
jgi:6-pyruvoyltetrahydropterin/6-carboxytetrahydropterin synthase